MDYENRVLPYISLALVSIIFFYVSSFITDLVIKNVLLSVATSGVFFFVTYLFYDVVRQSILKNELKYIHQHIRQEISSNVLIALYSIKKIIYGYNLDTNTLDNIIGIADLKYNEIQKHLSNQIYIGFQIFKSGFDMANLFNDAVKDNIFIKFSSHLNAIELLKISNNFKKIELIFRNPDNFQTSAEQGVEFKVLNGKDINPDNDEKLLLVRKTAHSSRFVVYDSGYFEGAYRDKLLQRYILRKDASVFVSRILDDTFSLLKKWIPSIDDVNYRSQQFRIIKSFLTEKTEIKNRNASFYTADIVETKNT